VVVTRLGFTDERVVATVLFSTFVTPFEFVFTVDAATVPTACSVGLTENFLMSGTGVLMSRAERVCILTSVTLYVVLLTEGGFAAASRTLDGVGRTVSFPTDRTLTDVAATDSCAALGTVLDVADPERLVTDLTGRRVRFAVVLVERFRTDGMSAARRLTACRTLLGM
jgi:hypothetical protein